MVTTRFKKTQNTSSTMVVSNDDLLIEILSRLPAKSILRFKSVSKHWLWLLSQRSFTLLFDKLSISPGFFFENSYFPFDDENQSTPPFRSLHFCHDPRGIKIVQSCNGLLLCCSANGSKVNRKYYVFNPTTKQFAVIPPVIGGHDVLKKISSMGLAFHHTDCAHYKLVCLYYANSAEKPDTEITKIQIYSSDTRNWRISNESFRDPRSFSTYVVYWNGSLHWAAPFDHAFYFKLDVEQIKNLPLPDNQDYASFFPLYFGESRGHMILVENANFEGSLQLNVYEMLSDHSAWFLKYQIDLHELLEAYPMIIYYLSYPPNQSNTRYSCKILDVVRGEKEEDTFMVIKFPNKIIKYNILDKSFKPIFDLTGSFLYRDEVHRYIEMIGSF